MQGIIDATCTVCQQPIQWDTVLPRLCSSCFEALLHSAEQQAQPQPVRTYDQPAEEAS